MPSKLETGLIVAERQSRCIRDDDMRADVLQCSRYLIEDEHTVGSDIASVLLAKANHTQIKQGRRLAAAVAIAHERLHWRELESIVTDSNSVYEPLLYIEAGTYDGVDLRVKAGSNIRSGLLRLVDAEAEAANSVSSLVDGHHCTQIVEVSGSDKPVPRNNTSDGPV